MLSSVLSILLALPLWISFNNNQQFLFGEDLQRIECKVGQILPVGELQFCILGCKGRPYGTMPAVFLKKEDGEIEEIWRDKDRGFNPWKIRVVELDDDPEPEIALGVYKKTRRDSNLAKRLFVYDWTGYSLSAKWLGSSLSLPMEDFKFARTDDDKFDHLFAIETGSDFKLIREYRWNGFGFTEVKIILFVDKDGNMDQLYKMFENI